MDAKTTLPTLSKLSLLIVFLSFFHGFGQNQKELGNLITSYKEYTEIPRETAYAHLNKTQLLNGEILGFAAYIFDKSDKKLSPTATNIYCTISDERNNIIKSQMVLGDHGVGRGSFEIDSLFTPGNYTFRVYTNWMRNFEEQNYFVQAIKIMDSKADNSTTLFNPKLDAQFLPDGGHLIVDIKNSVGIIVKDSLGFGVPEVSGKVIDSKNNSLIDFRTNKFGIGKFSFIPKAEESYKVILDFDQRKQRFPIGKAEPTGIALTMNDLENRVALSFRTNKKTLEKIKNQHFTLAIHNGNILKTIEVSFGNSQEVLKVINYDDLNPGINIFTLFDENNKPILERLFFKYEGIQFLTAENPEVDKSKDSVDIRIRLKNINPKELNNFSISVLPTGTKSYNPNNNIISQTYLQLYIRSFIEDASYYFTDITRKKKIELDNVLLTQGWSSYNWNGIFNNPPKANYEYENGISFRASANIKKVPKYMMFATINNEMKTFEMEDDVRDFGAIGLYPMDSEELRFSAIKKNNHIEKPNLYLQFFPSKIPDLNRVGTFAPLKERFEYNAYSGQKILQSSWEQSVQLDEVVIEGHKVLSREDKLTRNAFGKVDVIDDDTRKSYVYLSNFIRSRGFKVFEYMGTVMILNPRFNSFGQGSMGSINTTVQSIKMKGVKVYWNDIPLANNDMLYMYTMDDIDYIYFDKSGTSDAGSGAPGVIKIYTDPLIAQSKMKRNVSQDIAVPLSFSVPKKFYVPEYSAYDGPFYRDYGVIDWFPKLQIQKDGSLHFRMPSPKTKSISIYIEGTANDGSFLSGKKDISID